jgi:hypothetical protein
VRHGCGADYRLAAPQPKIGAAVLPVLTIFGLSATAPQRASTIFESLRTCMGKHNRAITVVLCLAFGALVIVGALQYRHRPEVHDDVPARVHADQRTGGQVRAAET